MGWWPHVQIHDLLSPTFPFFCTCLFNSVSDKLVLKLGCPGGGTKLAFRSSRGRLHLSLRAGLGGDGWGCLPCLKKSVLIAFWSLVLLVLSQASVPHILQKQPNCSFPQFSPAILLKFPSLIVKCSFLRSSLLPQAAITPEPGDTRPHVQLSSLSSLTAP